MVREAWAWLHVDGTSKIKCEMSLIYAWVDLLQFIIPFHCLHIYIYFFLSEGRIKHSVTLRESLFLAASSVSSSSILISSGFLCETIRKCQLHLSHAHRRHCPLQKTRCHPVQLVGCSWWVAWCGWLSQFAGFGPIARFRWVGALCGPAGWSY